MNYRKILLLVMISLLINKLAFTQNDTTNDGTAKAHAGVVFNVPAGNWWPIPMSESLAPNIDNRLQEELEKTKKVTIIFSSQNGAMSVLDILTGVYDNLHPKWDNILLIEEPHIISDPFDIGNPMKFSATYRAIDMKTKVSFRIEVIVATAWQQKGNRGILYIITPERKYYENRYFIAKLKDSLSMNGDSSHSNNNNQKK